MLKQVDRWLTNVFFLVVNLGIILIPLIFNLATQELFEFPKMLVVYALATLTTSLWLARQIISKKPILPNSPLDIPILLFLAAQLISSIFSLHQYTSIFGYYGRFNGGLLSTIAYSLIFLSLAGTLTNLHRINPKKAATMVKILLTSLVLASFLTTIYAIPEKFNHSPSCLFATGQFNTECWKESTNPRYRIFGTFGQPNWLAAWLVMVIPIGAIILAQSLKKHQWLLVGFYSINLALAVWAIWLTGSRSGLLGLLGSVGIFGITFFLTEQKTKKLKLPFLILSICFFGLFGFFAQKWWQKSQIVELNSQAGSDSGAIRKVVWNGAITIFKNHFWLGTGPETFAYSYYKFKPNEHNLLSEWDFLYNKAHNEYLNFLANSGIIGFASLLLLQASVLWLGIKNFTNKKSLESISYVEIILPIRLINLGLTASFLGLQISNFFGFSTVTVNFVSYLFFAILAWSASLTHPINTENKKASKLEKAHDKLNLVQKLALVLLFFLHLGVQKSILNIWQADTLFTHGLELLKTGFLDSGSQAIIEAIKKRPQEALFYDHLADQYASFSQSFDSQGEKTLAYELKDLADGASQAALSLNPHQLNFYKTRVRILTKLINLAPAYANQALDWLIKAQTLAPNDPKLMYNKAKIQLYLDLQAEGVSSLEKTLEFKPNYPEPRFELGQVLFSQGKLEEARTQYQYILENLNSQDQVSLEKIKLIDQLILKK